jgi:hypothetical protein
LSALFACRHIEVVSKSGHINACTDDILSLKPISVKPNLDWNGVTVITLTGIDFDTEKLKSTLNDLSMGFPIPVVLNDETLQRSHAHDSGLAFVETEIGAVYLSGVGEPVGTHTEFEVYLQGLPIYSSYRYGGRLYGNRHIVHLDSKCFYARLPDRDKLIDEKEVVESIKAALTKTIGQHFMTLKKVIADEAFVQFYGMLKEWKLLDLLNDVPVVPKDVLKIIDGYPVIDSGHSCSSDYLLMPIESFSRKDIEARAVFSISNDIQTEGAARFMFAWKKDGLLYDGGLDAGHWLIPLVRNLDHEDVTVEVVNETHSSQFQGDWVWVGVTFCDGYKIHIAQDCAEFTQDALYEGEDFGGRVIMPRGGSSAVVKQISSFMDEYDNYQESAFESDKYALDSFIVANTATNPADALHRLLPGFAGCPSVYGKAFVVTLNETGAVASVTLAVS